MYEYTFTRLQYNEAEVYIIQLYTMEPVSVARQIVQRDGERASEREREMLSIAKDMELRGM